MKMFNIRFCVRSMRKTSAVAIFYFLLFITLFSVTSLVVETSNSGIGSYNAIARESVDDLGGLFALQQHADAIQMSSLRLIFNTEEDDMVLEKKTIDSLQDSYSACWEKITAHPRSVVDQRFYDSLALLHQRDLAARDVLIREAFRDATSNSGAVSFYYSTQKAVYDAYLQFLVRRSTDENRQLAAGMVTTESIVRAASQKIKGLLFLSFLILVGGSVAVSLHHRRLMRLQRELLIEREQKQAEITLQTMTAQEKERNELGRELHDNVNQLLAAAKLNLSVVIGQPDKSGVLVPRSMGLLNEAVEEIRSLSKTLVSPFGSDTSLTESIRELVDRVRPLDKKITFDIAFYGIDDTRVTPSLKLTIYRTLQEQLNNILKHAQASQVGIYLSATADRVTLKVVDNGIGFDTSQCRKGIGVTNMINRAAAHGGCASIESAPGEGYMLTVRLPLATEKPASPRVFFRKMVAVWH